MEHGYYSHSSSRLPDKPTAIHRHLGIIFHRTLKFKQIQKNMTSWHTQKHNIITPLTNPHIYSKITCINESKGENYTMLITTGNLVMGTALDAIDQMALELKIGDCLTFGSFIPEVDSGSPAIRLPMLWHVIDRTGNKLKLLSYFFFEHIGYWNLQGNIEMVTWENSEIRSHLNYKFYNDCFDDNEKEAILTTEVKTKTDHSSCMITKDKLYVPSLAEIENIPDHLKIGRGLYPNYTNDHVPALELMYCFYWLRDIGEYENEHLIVQGYADSELVLDSFQHDSDEVGVRAVMWVNAEKI